MTTTMTTWKATWQSAITVALAVVTVGSVGAQSNDQVGQAVAAGLKGKGKAHGLVLRDKAQGFLNALDAGLNGSSNGSTGFWLEAFTPLAWIQQQAADAAKEYRTMTVDDVTEAMREPVLRVFVHPDTPNTVTARGMTGTSSVQHVVLRDKIKKVVIQPISKEPFTEESKNAMGGSATFTGVVVMFELDALREIRGPNNDQEFYITVIGDREEKNFEVKKKHFDDLKVVGAK